MNHVKLMGSTAICFPMLSIYRDSIDLRVLSVDDSYKFRFYGIITVSINLFIKVVQLIKELNERLFFSNMSYKKIYSSELS